MIPKLPILGLAALWSVLSAFAQSSQNGPTSTSLSNEQSAQPIHSHDAHAEEHAVGFLARNNEKADESEFRSTIDYLNKQLPHYKFSLIALDFRSMEDNIQLKRIDFLIANPVNFVEMEDRHNLRAIATLRRSYQKKSSTKYGGVIFGLADGPAKTQLKDLVGKQICAVSENSFGGMRMQMVELKRASVSKDDLHIQYAETHDKVIKKVLDTSCAFGFVRTAALEHYCDANRTPLTKFKVVHAIWEGDFPYVLSTEALYPEWPFAALPQADEDLVSKVASALLAMPHGAPPDSAVPPDSEVLSWSPPSNYNSARAFIIEPSESPYHFSEMWTFSVLSLVFASVLVAAAERGRRRRSVSLRPGNFFPCVMASLSTKNTAILILLLIGSGERAVEALVHGRVARGSLWLNVAIGISAFVGMALAMHAIFGKATHRGETLSKLEDLLGGLCRGEGSWNIIEDYCKANRVTEDEFDSVESRILAARKSRLEPALANLSKHRVKWDSKDQIRSHEGGCNTNNVPI
jgi:ABC-type phosphate/phosphonate transport system substrate-binding protein